MSARPSLAPGAVRDAGRMWRIEHGDCLEVMAGMDAASIDAVVCDPPYGLEFMGKSWDKLDGGRGKASARAMQEWHEAWAVEALRVLKPSHYLLAFGGTRTWHRLACAIEGAGFEIRDTLMWLYGGGFPKGKACLKPAWEPVILAKKPGPMRELGIEECRIGVRDESKMYVQPRPTTDKGGASWSKGEHVPFHYGDSGGRWPANVILDEAAAATLDEQSGIQRDGFHVGRNRDGGEIANRILGGRRKDTNDGGYGGGGGASRFYYCAKASRSERNAGCEMLRWGTFQSEGTDKFASNHHPTVKPVALMRWLVRLVVREGDTVLDPFIGSGTTGVACAMEGRDFIGIECEAEYVEIARRRIEAADAQGRLPI